MWERARRSRGEVKTVDCLMALCDGLEERLGRVEADRDALRRAVCLDTTASPSLGNRGLGL
ncbi:MAG: hypothetical protein CVV44_22545 [Spirochaetae bacterium HGW-Spirochaetae-1]|nr:MAG: hypothetical protein CVV44_22545 [Spirochaetae bacterium HGW-Spirochaetae-1]